MQSNSTITIVDASGNAVVVAVAAAVPASGQMVMGSDGTLARFLLTDTGGRLLNKITDGTNVAAVKAASTAPVASDPALVVTISPNSGSLSNPSVGTTGSAVPTSATFIAASDGTNLTGLRIKPASTAAVATDPALVVAISPNNPITVGGVADVTSTGALGALNAAVQVNTAGLVSVGFQLAAGTLIGTIIGEVSFDGGTTWNATYLDTPTSGKVSSIVFASSNAATAATIVGAGGSGLSRIRVSAYTSGSANITVRATTRQDPSVLYAGPPATAVPPSVALIGASDGTNLQALRIKAASTAAVAADPALVVALSPNNSLKARVYDSNNRVVRSTVSQELKVAQLWVLADLTNRYELDTRLWDVLVATGGTVTHVPTRAALRTAVTATTGSSATLRTNSYFKYQAGFTQLASLSVIHSDGGQANQTREWGYFEDNNGIFWRLNGTTLSIVERSDTSGSVVDTTYLQSAWNEDKMDGTGASGITLDHSKGNLYEMEVQWYGVGTTRYFVNNILVHEVSHANTLAVPYMRTAKLPLQVKVANSGASVIGFVDLVCGRVAAQGQIHEPSAWAHSAFNTTDYLVSTTEVPVLSIRPKATYNSITNRSWLIPKLLTMSTEGNKISYRVLYGATLTGASWTSAAATSMAEYDQSSTAFSGGEELFRGSINFDSGEKEIELEHMFSSFGRYLRNAGFLGSGANANDTLTIVATNEATGKTRVRGSLTWDEIR